MDKKYTHKARKSMIQSRRNSPLTAQTSATCGGVAIGNVTPDLGDHRQHNTVVIIRGHIINTNNISHFLHCLRHKFFISWVFK